MLHIDPNDENFKKKEIKGGVHTQEIIKAYNQCIDLVIPDLGGDTSVDFMLGNVCLRTPEDYQKGLIEILASLREVIPHIEKLSQPQVFHNEASASLIDAFMGEKLSPEQIKLAEEQFGKVGVKTANEVRQERIAPIQNMSISDLFDE